MKFATIILTALPLMTLAAPTYFAALVEGGTKLVTKISDNAKPVGNALWHGSAETGNVGKAAKAAQGASEAEAISKAGLEAAAKNAVPKTSGQIVHNGIIKGATFVGDHKIATGAAVGVGALGVAALSNDDYEEDYPVEIVPLESAPADGSVKIVALESAKADGSVEDLPLK